MLNNVRLNTELVEGSRDARTVEAMRAALVDNEEGKGGARGGDAAGSEAEKTADFGLVVRVNVGERGTAVLEGARLR